MKLIISLLSLSLFSASGLASDTLDFSPLKREIHIMENILKASVATDKELTIRELKSSYLLGQGIHFSIHARAFNQRAFSFAGSDTNMAQWFDFDASDFDHHAFADQAEAISKQSLEIAMESIHQVSEQIRDLAENEREIEHDIRSLEREKRDVEFERRLSEKADIKQLEKRKADLAQQVAQLEKQKAALKEEKQTLKAKATKNKQQKQQEQAQKKQASIKQLEHTLSTMLCDYGAGLKHLPENEFVNFTLVNAGQDNEDLIYVFNKQDIQKCVMTKIDKNRLLAEAKKYAF